MIVKITSAATAAAGRMSAHLLRSALVVLILFPALASTSYAIGERANQAGDPPLRVGLLPHLSTGKLMKVYQPIIKHLERNLARPVIVHTAPNFKTYIERASRGDYDLYHTAPHLAALSESKNQFRRVSRFDRELHGIFVVKKDSPHKKLSDLKGKTITAPDPLAIITILGESTLLKQGIDIEHDVEIKHLTSHNNAMMHVVSGWAEAAVVGVSAYKKMKPQVRNKLRILSNTEKVPHMMFMANAGMPSADYEKLRAAMLAFHAKGAGAKFFADSVFGDMTEITDEDMRRLESTLKILEKRL